MPYSGTFLFRSTDAGAPQVINTAGKLTDMLQAVFVDGYNSLTAGLTISRTGSVATVNKTGHGFVTGQIVRNAGWDQAEYNVDAKVTRIDANNYSYAVAGAPVTPGTAAVAGTAKMCPLDWTPYANPGTNIRAWQQPVGSNQRWLAVSDNGSVSLNYARVKGFETLTANPLTILLPDSLGTGSFPNDTQLAAGMYIDKDNGGVNREWVLVSNRRMIHVIIFYAGASTARMGFSFGDFTSYKSTTDSFNTLLAANTASGGQQGWVLSQTSTAISGMYINRKYDGSAGPVGGFKPVIFYGSGGTLAPGTGTFTYPSTIGGGMQLQRMLVAEATAALDFRGHMPGLWFPWHNKPLAYNDTFSGAVGSSIAGRTFLTISAPSDGQVFFETSDTWD